MTIETDSGALSGTEPDDLRARLHDVEGRLARVERKVMVRSISRARAPTRQERVIMAMAAALGELGMVIMDERHPGWRDVLAEAYAVDRAFRATDGTYASDGTPMKPA